MLSNVLLALINSRKWKKSIFNLVHMIEIVHVPNI